MEQELVDLVARRETEAYKKYIKAKQEYEEVVQKLSQLEQELKEKKAFREQEKTRIYRESKNQKLTKKDIDKMNLKLSDMRQVELELENKKMKVSMSLNIKKKNMEKEKQSYTAENIKRQKFTKIRDKEIILQRNNKERKEEQDIEEETINRYIIH